MKVTAIFDIGKTNKKFFLFDENFQEVHKEYTRLNEVEDDDGYPCDDIIAIQNWIGTVMQKTLSDHRFQVEALNFSTYGASFVHVDKNGQPVAPIFNYLKPYPKELLASFYRKYGDKLDFSLQTSSPPFGMLNSGLQLYWLKYTRPEIYERIRWSLHFPQFLSFLFTGVPLSEYTSIGCHTGLWDYVNHDYHPWVYAEEFDRILAPIADTRLSINTCYQGKVIKTGVGIHDSSSALLPYMQADQNPFVLLSTGTWSISLNPFNQDPLTKNELRQDCLNFLRVDGKSVKAARLFLGNEYNFWIRTISEYFQQPLGKHKNITHDPEMLQSLRRFSGPVYQWTGVNYSAEANGTDLSLFTNYEEAYHKLIIDLVDLQVDSLRLAIGKTPVQRIFVDGGFLDNKLFIKLLTEKMSEYQVTPASVPLGSALGAAMVVHNNTMMKI